MAYYIYCKYSSDLILVICFPEIHGIVVETLTKIFTYLQYCFTERNWEISCQAIHLNSFSWLWLTGFSHLFTGFQNKVSFTKQLLSRTIACKIHWEFARFYWKSWFEVKVLTLLFGYFHQDKYGTEFLARRLGTKL